MRHVANALKDITAAKLFIRGFLICIFIFYWCEILLLNLFLVFYKTKLIGEGYH